MIYLKMCKNPIINSKIIPKIFAYIPIFLFEYLPINKPRNVKKAAQMLKIKPDKRILFVIALKPSPVEKLSKLTDNDTKNILNKFNSKQLSSHFIKSIIISTPIIKRIIPNKKLTLIFKNSIILLPKIVPNKGIKKCIIPTKKPRKSIFFLLKLKVPNPSDIENVSIDKDRPIINKETNIDT